MQITFSALGGAVRLGWIQVVVSRTDRAKGYGSIKARALPQLVFDELWGALIHAEQEYGSNQSPTTAEQLRAAQDDIIRRMVIGHDPGTFTAKFPVPATDDEKTDLIALLAGMGFTPSESSSAIQKGALSKPFASTEVSIAGANVAGCSQGTIDFYRACQPFGVFIISLLHSLHGYQHGAVLTAEELWAKEEAKKAPPSDPTPAPE